MDSRGGTEADESSITTVSNMPPETSGALRTN